MGSDCPSISVVIPAYNAEKHIARAVESALRQSYAPLEIIVVDDGSTDATREIASRFGGTVRTFAQQNAGASAARNRGIKEAGGEIVAFLDADDEWYSFHLELAVAVFRAKPDLVWCVTACEKRSEGIGLHHVNMNSNRTVDGTYFADYLAEAAHWVTYTPATLVRRSVLSKLGGFCSDLQVGEDLELWLRIALRNPEVGYSPKVSVTIWETAGSLTKQGLFDPEKGRSFLERCERIAEEFGAEGCERARGLICRWARAVSRKALYAGDVNTLRWIDARYGSELPFVWRIAIKTCFVVPQSVLRFLLSTWENTRRIRIRSRGLFNRRWGVQRGCSNEYFG